ncbi:MAG: hypothetical protein WAW75_00735 [Gallionella sp.]
MWFVLFSAVGLGGAVGVLLYCLALFLNKHWADEYEEHMAKPLAIRPSYRKRIAKSLLMSEQSGEAEPDGLMGGDSGKGGLGGFARYAFYYLDWLLVRLTAMTFAIVGNFEDTIHCWRTQAASWSEIETGILLSSGAGAQGVRLGMPIPQGGLSVDRHELGAGEEADVDFMQSTIGLVWRSVVFWLLLMLLLLASLLG